MTEFALDAARATRSHILIVIGLALMVFTRNARSVREKQRGIITRSISLRIAS